MIKNLNIEYSEEIIEDVIMEALEHQFRRTESCMNKAENDLHKRTEIALSIFYNRISERSNPIVEVNNLINKFNS